MAVYPGLHLGIPIHDAVASFQTVVWKEQAVASPP